MDVLTAVKLTDPMTMFCAFVINLVLHGSCFTVIRLINVLLLGEAYTEMSVCVCARVCAHKKADLIVMQACRCGGGLACVPSKAVHRFQPLVIDSQGAQAMADYTQGNRQQMQRWHFSEQHISYQSPSLCPI